MPFLWGKRKEEVKELKEAVTGPETAAYPPLPPLSFPSLPRQPTPSYPPMPPEKFAPLFVKVDKYKDILETIAKLKGTLANIGSILTTKLAIDKLREQADALLQRQVNVCTECANALDSAMVKPPALGSMVVAQPEIIEPDLQTLSNRLTQLSDQLRQMG